MNYEVNNLISGIKVLRRVIKKERVTKFINILNERNDGINIILENLSDPMNGSASLRTGDCFGIQNYHLIESVDKFNQLMTKNCNLNVDKWLTINRYQHPKDCLLNLKKQNILLLASTLNENSQSLETILNKLKNNNNNKLPKLALMFGNENRGLSNYCINNSDYCFKLPMVGFSQSLNLNVSIGISLTVLQQNNAIRYNNNNNNNNNEEEEDEEIIKQLKDVQDIKQIINSNNQLIHPLTLNNKLNLLFKWLYRSYPHSNRLLKSNKINIDYL